MATKKLALKKNGRPTFGDVRACLRLSGQLLGLYESGALEEEIVWLGAFPVGTIQGGAAYSIAPDHLGAPYKIVNSANAQVWLWDHDPFGNGAPTAAAGFSHSLRFPGQVHDVESGLHSNGRRDYDPRLGRYVESDPVGLEGGINTYAYANNNPVNSVDPTGTVVTPETLWDLGNVAMGVYSLFDNYRNGNYLAAGFDGLGLGVDVVATVIPILPGGAAAAIAASRGAVKGASEASSLADAARLRGQLAGNEIAGGHAFEKHVLSQGEFRGLDIRTREQFARHIESVINNPTASRELSGGRTAYWQESTSTVVIRNPRAADGGTAFQPKDGREYFESLR
jgi:RHS repeat-associated protein